MPNHLVLLFSPEFHSLPHSIQRQVYDEFYHLIYPLVFFILKDHGAAEDVIQESFLRALNKAAQLKDKEKHEGWLKALARNATYNYLRKFSKTRKELDAVDVFPRNEVSRTGSTEPPVSEQVELKMMEQSLSGYLDLLNPEYRQIIEMRWIHNLSYKEMAAALNSSEGAIRQKLFRARDAIKTKFRSEWREQ